MITLEVDEGYAFDYLAILQVKKENDEEQTKVWEECFTFLGKQFSPIDWSEIINSEEFSNLVLCNQKTFNAVEKARYGEITAKEVDNCNMERYNAKIKLQNKFFKTSATEFKT